MLYRSVISGTGSYLPERSLTNRDLERMVDTNDQWITKRTGIAERRIAAPDQATSDLAHMAALKALEAAQLKPGDIDAILLATVSPDHQIPSSACLLQARLKCRSIMALDVSAACSGFLNAFTIADQFIKTGTYRHVLVVGAETLSRFVNYEDRQTCIIFGDGAGACVLSRNDTHERGEILSWRLNAVGDMENLLVIPGGGSRMPVSQDVVDRKKQFIEMRGADIFRHAVRSLQDRCQEVLDDTHMTVSDVDTFLLHQANQRILESVAEAMHIPMSKLPCNIMSTGNTSSASIPILLDQQIRKGEITRGQIMLMAAFGAGLTSGSVLMRY